jgi:hypothetical protein
VGLICLALKENPTMRKMTALARDGLATITSTVLTA